MSLFDILVGLIVVWGSYRGLKSGLIKSLGGLLGWAAGIAVALSFSRSLAGYLDQRFDAVAAVGEFIIRFIPLPNLSFEADNITRAVVNAGVQEMALPDFLKISLIENINGLLVGGNHFDLGLPELISHGLAAMVLNGLSFLILFIVAGTIIKIGFNLLSKVVSITPLGSVNKLSGAVLGFLMSVVIVTVIAGVLSPVLIISAAQNDTVASIIYSSLLFPYLLELFLLIGSHIFGLINFPL